MPLPEPSEQLKLAQIDPEIQAFMQSPAYNRSMEIDYTDPIRGLMDLRVLLGKLGASPPNSSVKESVQTYNTADGMTLRLIVYTPASLQFSETLPLLVWYHGGGGCTGSPDGQAAFCNSIVLSQNCIVVCPEYRLAPEYSYPTGLNDCWEALQSIASRADQLSANLSTGFVIAGESFGAVLSATIALRARDNPLSQPLTGVFLSAGSYVPPHNPPEEFKPHYLSRFDPVCMAGPGLSAEAKKAFDLAFKPDYDSPRYRAAIWPSGHVCLPRTYFQTCGWDINRDEAFVYQEILRRAGVETRLDMYPGAPHCFWWSFPQVKLAEKWRLDTAKGISWLFGTE